MLRHAGKTQLSATGHSSGLKRSSFGTVHGSGISEMAQGMSGPNGQRSSQFSEAFFKVRCFLLMAKERRKEIVVFFDHKTPLVHFFVVTWSRRSILPEVSLKVKEVCHVLKKIRLFPEKKAISLDWCIHQSAGIGILYILYI